MCDVEVIPHRQTPHFASNTGGDALPPEVSHSSRCAPASGKDEEQDWINFKNKQSQAFWHQFTKVSNHVGHTLDNSYSMRLHYKKNIHIEQRLTGVVNRYKLISIVILIKFSKKILFWAQSYCEVYKFGFQHFVYFCDGGKTWYANMFSQMFY